jgi:ribosomal-protein-alanine N-acetyltransferase
MGALITGTRVLLRHPTADDEAEFLALRHASRELHVLWEPAAADGVDAIGPAAFAEMLERSNSARHQKHLVCRLDDGRICGYVGLNEIVLGPFRSAYLGYWTGAPFVRQGYATEAVELCLRRAFVDLGLHRVEANVIPTNAASLAIARRCGMRKEGYSPRYLQIAGVWQDHERWAVTVEDWTVAERARA